ncbi:Mitochondrial Folate Transporter/Carrier [Manis pentadactyla]|nr:Mitochondrial Folate Transporter/Carrier [Manis pentadactyla]
MDLPGAPPLFSARSDSEANTVLQDRPEAAEDVASCQLVPMLGGSSSLLVMEAPHAGVSSAGAARLLPRHPAAIGLADTASRGTLDQGLEGFLKGSPSTLNLQEACNILINIFKKINSKRKAQPHFSSHHSNISHKTAPPTGPNAKSKSSAGELSPYFLSRQGTSPIIPEQLPDRKSAELSP